MASAVFNLSSLNGANGFILNGIDAGDRSGYSVAAAGDVNGDGIDDIIVGAVTADPNGASYAGESYVVFGTSAGFAASLDLSALDGTNGFVLNGIDSGDRSGVSVASAGDVNGDGIDDLIIGANRADPNGASYAGESYVVFGMSAGFAASLDLAALNGTNGFVLNGIDAFDFSGRSVASAGDVNGDGIDDLIVGAGDADPNGAAGAGESYVVFGTSTGFAASLDLSTLNGTNGFVLNGIDSDDRSGYSVAAAGDVNGDGIDDIIVGAVNADPNGASDAGESYVVFGTSAGFAASLDLSALDGTNGFVLNGIDAEDRSGFSVALAGDVNGDGIDDLIIGANRTDPNGASGAGESYVVFGTSAGFAASLNLSALDGTNGFVLNGIDADDRSGMSVASAGDFNGDGIDDLLIAAYAADPNGASSAGESYVVFGTSAGFAASLELSALDGTNGFVLNGINDNDRSGFSVASAGDVNGDGIDDIVAGAFGANPNGVTYAGESYVIFGSTAFGADVDATGFDDVLQGNGAGNEFTGLEGDDTLFGLVGNDTLRGGEDNDTLIGGAGVDQFDGGAGTDTADYSASNGVWVSLFGTQLFGEAAGETFTSVENLVGSSFSDTLEGDNGANVLSARNGSDRLKGAGGADLLLGGAGDDNLDGGAGLDTLDGGSGTDAADYQSFGGGVSVNLSAGTALSGGALNASGFYAGGALEDILVGIEDVIGTPFADRLVAISTGSRLLGQNGSDRLSGLGGRDLLIGGEGDDTLEGGGNSDTLSGGVGFDLIDGGTGLDTASYSDFATGGLSVNVINGVALSGGFVNASGFYQGGATEDAIVNVENIIGSDFTDRLVAGSTSAEVDGRGGNDVISTFSGNDTIFGGEGDDRIGAGQSTDQLFGGNGNDTLNGGTGLDTLDGGGNIDTADYSDRTGGVSVNLVSGSALTGGALNASGFYGGGFTEDSLVSIEAVIGTAFGDRLVAGLFASRLEGRGGHDNISGLTGDDTVAGGAGNDTLSGGDGNDTFEFAPGFGADRITDFAEGAGAGDVIRFVGFGLAFDSFAEVIAVASQAGGDVVFDFGGGNTITVASATVAGFAADDFSFG